MNPVDPTPDAESSLPVYPDWRWWATGEMEPHDIDDALSFNAALDQLMERLLLGGSLVDELNR